MYNIGGGITPAENYLFLFVFFLVINFVVVRSKLPLLTGYIQENLCAVSCFRVTKLNSTVSKRLCSIILLFVKDNVLLYHSLLETMFYYSTVC